MQTNGNGQKYLEGNLIERGAHIPLPSQTMMKNRPSPFTRQEGDEQVSGGGWSSNSKRVRAVSTNWKDSTSGAWPVTSRPKLDLAKPVQQEDNPNRWERYRTNLDWYTIRRILQGASMIISENKNIQTRLMMWRRQIWSHAQYETNRIVNINDDRRYKLWRSTSY